MDLERLHCHIRHVMFFPNIVTKTLREAAPITCTSSEISLHPRATPLAISTMHRRFLAHLKRHGISTFTYPPKADQAAMARAHWTLASLWESQMAAMVLRNCNCTSKPALVAVVAFLRVPCAGSAQLRQKGASQGHPVHALVRVGHRLGMLNPAIQLRLDESQEDCIIELDVRRLFPHQVISLKDDNYEQVWSKVSRAGMFQCAWHMACCGKEISALVPSPGPGHWWECRSVDLKRLGVGVQQNVLQATTSLLCGLQHSVGHDIACTCGKIQGDILLTRELFAAPVLHFTFDVAITMLPTPEAVVSVDRGPIDEWLTWAGRSYRFVAAVFFGKRDTAEPCLLYYGDFIRIAGTELFRWRNLDSVEELSFEQGEGRLRLCASSIHYELV